MITSLKRKLYFPVASYFKFFALIQLKIWHPKIIVVTGSNGKTTTLHLLESQLGENAKYSHLANSSFGIPFDILGFKRQKLTIGEWPTLFLLAPFKAFIKQHKEKIYIVEADCDRPHEGFFLASLLKPEITLWLSVSRTHSRNFDELVGKQFPNVQDAIAYEFGHFIEQTSKLVIVNGDLPLIKKQFARTRAKIIDIRKNSELQNYQVGTNGTNFKIGGKNYSFNVLLPEDTFYGIDMCIKLLEFLNKTPNPTFPNFNLPPGRSSLFKGIKNTTIIDSTYNATPASISQILSMFSKIRSNSKWLVLGDMVELGKKEAEEHQKLAPIIADLKAQKVILVGPRLIKYTYPKLSILVKSETIQKFEKTKDALNYLKKNLKGKELILFKGARFLEGIIEKFLLDKNDIKNLPRRENIWRQRRKKWGL